MKREFLKTIGVSEDLIDRIMEENGKDINKAKGDLSAAEAERDNLRTQIEQANEQIKAFKDMDIEGIKRNAEQWESKYAKAVKDGEDKLNALKFDHCLDGMLTAAKAKNVKAVKALLNMDGLKQNGDEIIGLKEQLDALKADNDYIFESEQPVPKVVGPTGSPVGGTGSTPFGFNFTGVRAKENK